MSNPRSKREAVGRGTLVIATIAFLLLLICPASLAQTDTQVFSGTSYSYQVPPPTGGNTYEYLWKASAGTSNSYTDRVFVWTPPDVTVPTEVTINVTVNCISCGGCAASNEIKLKVNSKPSVTISTPDAQLNCTTECPIIKATVSNIKSSDALYAWFRDGQSYSGTGSTIQPCQAGSYTVTVTNQTATCSATSSPLIIKPYVTPTVTISTPDAQLNCTTECPIIKATVSNIKSSDALYAWFRDGQSYSGTGSTIQPCQAGSYTVTVTNQTTTCSVTSSPLIIKPYVTPTVTISTPDTQLNCTTKCPIIKATVSNIKSSDALYAWFKDGQSYSGADSTIQPCQAGSYTVTVTNQTTTCSATSSPLIIKPYVTPTVTISTPDAQLNCTGKCPTLSAKVKGTLGDYTIEWFNGATRVGSDLTYSACSAGTYHAVATDTKTGCTGESATLTIQDKPSLSIAISTPDAQLNCTGKCPTLSAKVTGTLSDYTIEWFNGATKVGSDLTYSACSAGTYQAVVTDTKTGCTGESATLMILDKPAPTVTISTPDAQLNCTGKCPMIMAKVSGTLEGYNIDWFKGESKVGSGLTFEACEPGTYNVVVTNTKTGCTGTSNDVQISQALKPTIEVTPETAAICSGEMATLTASASGCAEGQYQYHWHDSNDQPIVDATTATFKTVKAGAYKCVVTCKDTSCSSSATSIVNVNPLPQITIQPISQSACLDNSVSFSATTAGQDSLNYQWYKGSTALSDVVDHISGSTTSTLSIIQATAEDAGDYHVEVTNGLCSNVSASATLTILAGAQCQIVGPTFKISGIKFHDLNANGIRDQNEPGLGNWQINLQKDGDVNNPILTQNTLQDGSYSFTSLPPGTYKIWESNFDPVWIQTAPPSGSTSITIESSSQTVDFGNRKKLTPGLNCVKASQDGSYTATFTYDNPNGDISAQNLLQQVGGQPEIFQSGHHSFTVTFAADNTLTWTLDGQQVTASKDSTKCIVEVSPLVVTKTVNTNVADPGSIVTFTITAKNNGDATLTDVQLVDSLPPGLIYVDDGTQPKPANTNGNTLTWDLGTLAPSESTVITLKTKIDPESNRVAIIDTQSVTPVDGKLTIMAAKKDPANLQQIIDQLTRNRTKLEAKLETMKKHQNSFDKARATLTSSNRTIEGTVYTFNNYTNATSGETLSEALNVTGFLVKSGYGRIAQGDTLEITYGSKGEVLSDFYVSKATKEFLRINYDKPTKGYRTYYVSYYVTGNTLIIIVDSNGNVISKEYRKTPGEANIPAILKNCAKAYATLGGIGIESNVACADVSVSFLLEKPSGLRVIKDADPKIVTAAGQKIKYTYTVQNTGTTTITLLTLQDDKIGLVNINPPVTMLPGASLSFEAYYIVKAEDMYKTSLVNVVTAKGVDDKGKEISDEARAVVNVVAASLTKTASPKTVKPGDLVTYTITYNNPGGKAIINDTYPKEVSFISAYPGPDSGDNIWNIAAGSSGTITIVAEVAKDVGNVTFDLAQNVKGTGFVNIHNDVCTEPYVFVNKVTMHDVLSDGKHDFDLSASTDVTIGKPNTCVSLKEHGSGSYQSEDLIKYQNSNRSIVWNKSLTATYKPTSFSLPKNRSVKYTTKWIEKSKAKNYATGASMNVEYTNAYKINRNSSLALDQNGSTMREEANFEGMGHIGLLKKSGPTANASTVFESQEDYVGKFGVYVLFDEYGQNAKYQKSVAGTGFVAANKSIENAQRSYESGTGSYQSQEKISTATNYIAKDINVKHAPTDYNYSSSFRTRSDLKWKEGMKSKTANSMIGEEFSSAERLKKESIAIGLNEMDTQANFSGNAKFRTVYKDKYPTSTNEVNLDEGYSGNYTIARKTLIAGVAKYGRPHLSLSKVGNVDLRNTTLAEYKITVENDGNKDLGSLYVRDAFPPGTQYVSSTLRPTELSGTYANWTLDGLGSGSKIDIGLLLDIVEEPSNLVNRVEAAGAYGENWTTARNFSAIQLNWLTCCPPQMTASKMAWVDSKDPKIAWYKITLKNREKYTMVAFVIDNLAGSMRFLNSSLEPSDLRPDQITWSILDLGPGEKRSIVYRTEAQENGTFVNTAHIEAYSVDGPDSAISDVTAQVDIGAGKAASYASRSGPLACFGLNCSGADTGPDWVPCSSCGAIDPEPTVVTPVCTGCTEVGSDIP